MTRVLAAAAAPALEVTNLSTQIKLTHGAVEAVGNVDLHIAAGETLGLVGESGCGKSMTGLSILGLLPTNGRIVSGSVRLDGRELVGLSGPELRAVRGNDVAMIFQDSQSSLNPTKTIGEQVAEPVMLHWGASRKAAAERAAEVLDLVGVPHPAERLGDYPHQLSGGLRQRVMIAMALSCEPKVLIADEPTTALDVTIQAQILTLLDRLKERLGMAVLLITHDMGVIAGRADRVDVMYAGRIVEAAEASELFARMRHPYTQGLIASIPRLDQDSAQALFAIPGRPPELSAPPPGCRYAARCGHVADRCRHEEPALAVPDLPGHELSGHARPDHRVACWYPVDGPLVSRAVPQGDGGGVGRPVDDLPLLRVEQLVREFPVTSGVLQRQVDSVKAVSGISLDVRAGEILGLVGESGCGKSTLGRMIVGLERPDAGRVTLDGVEVFASRGRRLRRQRRDLQMMFQDPYASLNPRMRVGAILREPLSNHGPRGRRRQDDRISELLEEVGLPPSAADRYPHEFSGGQRQRVGLARALALNPKVIVADEPVSALDVSIRSQVLNLMKRTQDIHGTAYVVISHDLAVVKYLADRIAVMYLGKVVEQGPSDDIYLRPAHPYTAALLAAIPVPDPATERTKRGTGLGGELPSARRPPSGCRFRTRCPRATERCAEEEPVLRAFSGGHTAACHFPLQPVPEAGTSQPEIEAPVVGSDD